MCHHWRNKVNLSLTGIVLINFVGIGKLVFLLYDRRQLDVISLFRLEGVVYSSIFQMWERSTLKVRSDKLNGSNRLLMLKGVVTLPLCPLLSGNVLVSSFPLCWLQWFQPFWNRLPLGSQLTLVSRQKAGTGNKRTQLTFSVASILS